MNVKSTILNETEWLFYYLSLKPPLLCGTVHQFPFYVPDTLVYRSAHFCLFVKMSHPRKLTKSDHQTFPKFGISPQKQDSFAENIITISHLKTSRKRFKQNTPNVELLALNTIFRRHPRKKVPSWPFSVNMSRKAISQNFWKEPITLPSFSKVSSPPKEITIVNFSLIFLKKLPSPVLIKVSWSPYGGQCFVEKKTNVHNLLTSKAPLTDRAVTFDGPENMSQLSNFFLLRFVFFATK